MTSCNKNIEMIYSVFFFAIIYVSRFNKAYVKRRQLDLVYIYIYIHRWKIMGVLQSDINLKDIY